MAIDNTSKTYAFMEFPLSISRQDAFPLDRNSVFYSLAEAQTYAQTSPLAYVGQLISVVVDGEASAYVIEDTAGTLTPLSGGSAPEIGIATAENAGIVKLSDEVSAGEDGALTIVSIPQSKVSGLETRLTNIESAAVGGVHYKGSVDTYDDLPPDAAQGDLYEVTEDNSEWCWNGTEWFEYGSTSGLKPVARADVNEAQFQISDNVLSIIDLNANLVTYGSTKLDAALDDINAAITWEDMA